LAQAALETVRAAVTRWGESVRLSTLHLEQLRTQQATAQTALEDWLERFNAKQQASSNATVRAMPHGAAAPLPAALDNAALQTLLALAPDWIAQERQALQVLQTATTTAQAVLAARKQSQDEHEAAKLTSDSAEALQAQLLAVNTAMAALADTLSALKLDIARDNERLASSAALRAQIAQQAATTRVWSQLGELIGSADGKKFRNFAQQLTLDILLGYGNSHLQALSRRYRIQRIADSLGLLVVDQDMGDEVRSVHSLSGGESFLVSLAMALGLASLSSHRVRVESLFIDEGFGSLDADSLRVAMDALDSLQSLGRKVGVISHVQEMTERIGTQVHVQRQSGGLSRIVVG
jgi:exonuclease SbcC